MTKGLDLTSVEHSMIMSSGNLLSMIGFIRRTCLNFREVATMKVIFSAHLRSHLEYCSKSFLGYSDWKSDSSMSFQANDDTFNNDQYSCFSHFNLSPIKIRSEKNELNKLNETLL